MARSVSQLKNRARREEQRENWARAIELYGEAIRLSEEAGDVSLDLSLYNRIGDLYRRQGDIDQAVRHYLEAVDQYADQGLHTGAIALCNKIQRLAPDRVEVYRKLGRLHAATGLLAEARNSFRQYLERQEEAGEEAACRDARLELARLVGDRAMLLEAAARMAEAGGEERERALEVLLELWHEPGADGDEELRRRILAMDPDAALDGTGTAGSDAAAPEEGEGAAGPDATGQDEARGGAADDAGGEPRAEGEEPPAPPAESPPEGDPDGDGEGTWASDLSDVLLDVERSEAEPEAAADEPPEGPGTSGEKRPSPGGRGEAERGTARAASDPGDDDTGEPGAGPDEKGYVDLGERIRRRLEAEGVPSGEDRDGSPSKHDFDDMLVGFRVQVDETEGEADAAAHLELGVALRQMGLLDDAIREFQVATRAPEPPLRAFELLGEAFIEKGLHGVAVRVLTRALHLPGRSDFELLGVLYQLGIAHQTEAHHEQALDCFERVYSIDIDFRDVAERLEAVRREA